MRLFSLFLLIAFGTSTHAAPPRKFTMTLDEHAISAKGGDRTEKSTFAVDGTKFHYEWTYQGPDSDKPKNKPRKVDVVIKNEADVDKWLAALEKTAVSPSKPVDPKKTSSIACITIGAKKRCETRSEAGGSTPGHKAIEELAIALLDNVPSP